MCGYRWVLTSAPQVLLPLWWLLQCAWRCDREKGCGRVADAACACTLVDTVCMHCGCSWLVPCISHRLWRVVFCACTNRCIPHVSICLHRSNWMAQCAAVVQARHHGRSLSVTCPHLTLCGHR
jgi:hypothetical protein